MQSDRVSRGLRVQEIQELAGMEDDNIAFAAELNRCARRLGIRESWHATRLSKVRGGTQGLSIEDMTVIALADPKRRGWTWVSFGLAVRAGEDAFEVLEREAAKRKRKAG